jgi:hypothetical protein
MCRDVMSSSNPALVDQPVTLTIEIDPPSGVTATPTGTVTFTDSGQSIGTATLQNGIAALTTQFGSAGDHIIVAQYSGDADFQPVNSEPFTEHVTEDDLFTVSVSPPMITQHAGASSDVSVVLFSNGSDTSPVHFDCENLPPGVTCSFQSNAVVPTASGAATGMTITSLAALGAKRWTISPLLYAGVFIPVLFIKRRRSILGLCTILFLSLTACGGHVRVLNGGTPPGSYNIQVFASDGTDTQRATIRLNIT